MIVFIVYFSSRDLALISSLWYYFSWMNYIVNGYGCKAFIYPPLKQTYAILLGWHHFSLSPPISIFHIDIYLDLNFELRE